MIYAAKSNRKPVTNASLTPLTALFSNDMENLNALILEKIEAKSPLIAEVAGHLLKAGGKRLRPLMTLATAALFGYRGDRAIQLAAAVEFIHTATLLHDDVVDNSSLRRGFDTANTVWGNKSSVLVGDFLFSRAFELMTASNDMRLLAILSSASAKIAEGEVMQLQSANNLKMTEDALRNIIDAKTACLFSAAAEVGAVIGAASAAQQQALKLFGHHFGMAYQLIDDLLDYKPATETGKETGNDYLDGKVTYPILFAYQLAESSDKQFLEGAFAANGKRVAEDLDKVRKIVEATGAYDKTYALAVLETDQALRCLTEASLSPSAALEALEAATTFCLERTF